MRRPCRGDGRTLARRAGFLAQLRSALRPVVLCEPELPARLAAIGGLLERLVRIGNAIGELPQRELGIALQDEIGAEAPERQMRMQRILAERGDLGAAQGGGRM